MQPTLPTLSEESPVKEQLAASSLQDPSGIEGSKSIPDDDQPAAKAPITEEVQVQLVDDLSNAPMKIVCVPIFKSCSVGLVVYTNYKKGQSILYSGVFLAGG